ncbi:hypothetical protein LUTEI9C_50182 [Luteimonas sp. 9C]|nr:hypothetical protein LUTEI9C_50182 [Luteimonas sp. 9C]
MPRSGISLNELLGAEPVCRPLAIWIEKQPDLALFRQHVGAHGLFRSLRIATVREKLEAGHCHYGEVCYLRLLCDQLAERGYGQARPGWVHVLSGQDIYFTARCIHLRESRIANLNATRLHLDAVYCTRGNDYAKSACRIPCFLCIFQ